MRRSKMAAQFTHNNDKEINLEGASESEYGLLIFV
jgi:hypothetical protein